MIPRIEIGDEARALGVYLAYTVVSEVRIGPGEKELEDHIEGLVREVRSRYTLASLKDHPVIRAYRDFMWRIGIDPTKVRPSSEALVRRILRKGSFPRINNVVDSGNIASVETLVPIGLYDLDRIEGNLLLGKASRGALFNPIGGKPEELTGRELVLTDSAGKILHVYPHRDSQQTMIRRNTRNVLVIATGVPGVSWELVAEAARRASNYLARYAGGKPYSGILKAGEAP